MHADCTNRGTSPESAAFCLSLVLLVLSAALAPTVLAHEARSSTVLSLDSDDWLLLPDPKNVGREDEWWSGPRPTYRADGRFEARDDAPPCRVVRRIEPRFLLEDLFAKLDLHATGSAGPDRRPSPR